LDNKIILNGGKNCGWKISDHDDFIKLKIKHKGQLNSENFLIEYKIHMGFLSENELNEHIQKYCLYISLEDEKKR